MSFQSVELSDPMKRTGPLLSGMEVSVPAGKTLAVVGLDDPEHNPLELLMERYFDHWTGSVVSHRFTSLTGCAVVSSFVYQYGYLCPRKDQID